MVVLQDLHLRLQSLHPLHQLPRDARGGIGKTVLFGNATDFVTQVGDVPVDGFYLGLDLHLYVLEDYEHFALDDLADVLLLFEERGTAGGGGARILARHNLNTEK